MKFQRSISILVLCITLFTLVVCLTGLLSSGGPGTYQLQSINNEPIQIYGTGLYRNDSVSAVAQGKASDLVTLVLGIPLLLLSTYFSRQGSFRGRLILTGTLAYFLYTFMSYSFLWTYNRFFILYVVLMALSLYAFILAMMSFDLHKIAAHFKAELPVKFLGIFQLFLGFALALLWIGRIAPSIISGAVPVGLEHYTTLVIQAMDLGIVVPAAILSGILLMQRKPFGYLLTSVLIIKGITMLTSLSAMIISMALSHVPMNPLEMMVFPVFNLVAIFCLVLLLKNTQHVAEI